MSDINEIYNELSERIFFFILKLVKNEQDAEELLQDTFVKVHENIGKFDYKHKLSTWIYKIARNLSLNFLNKKSTRNNMKNVELRTELKLSSDINSHYNPEKNFFYNQEKYSLFNSLEKLKPEFKEIIILKEYEDLSYKEISEILDISIGSVMSRLFYAKKSLIAIYKGN